MRLTHKFRLYPSKDQEERLSETLEACRQTYNYFLSQWNGKNKVPSRLTLQAQLPRLKEEKPELNKVHSKVLQMVLYQLYSNLRALSQLKKNGRKVGRLRFKGKGWYKTFIYNQSGFKIIRTGKRLCKLHLSQIGDISVRMHRDIEGEIKQITIKKYASGKWFVCVSVEEELVIEKKSVKKPVGLDMGLTYFVTDSDGRQIENPRYLIKSLKKLRKEQRRLSWKKKGSKNRSKQRIKVARVDDAILNQRNDFQHKLSRYYVDNYDLIAIENLNVKGMVRNHHLARSISDVGWSAFAGKLSYKAENAGKMVIRVDPKGTSQIYAYGELDRDYNASLNILRKGLENVGWGSAEFTPVDIEPLRELIQVPASLVIEAGSPQPFRGG